MANGVKLSPISSKHNLAKSLFNIPLPKQFIVKKPESTNPLKLSNPIGVYLKGAQVTHKGFNPYFFF
jgi:hypothetical protein|tara:strand:+ start:486 stop:686 length:201 start_codon:yes stop_codon:yes gene_type:complete